LAGSGFPYGGLAESVQGIGTVCGERMKLQFKPLSKPTSNNECRWIWFKNNLNRDWMDVPYGTETFEVAMQALEDYISMIHGKESDEVDV
jgi:hypothetical protein